MQEFIVKFKEANFEDDVYIRPVCISENSDDFIINFNVFLYGTHKIIQSWKVTGKNFENYKFINEFVEDIDVFQEHVLLWEYCEAQAELFFSGKVNNKSQIIGMLLTKHLEVTKGWIDLNYFLNKSLSWKSSLDWLFSGENGLLASGPANLLIEYKKIIEQNGLKTSLLPSKRQQTKYQVLIFGGSFVIAEEFIFELT
jgi:hypothetical protein